MVYVCIIISISFISCNYKDSSTRTLFINYLYEHIILYNYYHSWIIKFMTTFNSNISFNYIVLDAILPEPPTEFTEFISTMRIIIQEKKCISLSYGPDKEKRCLQWVLEMIDVSQIVVSKLFIIVWISNSKTKVCVHLLIL